MPDSSTVTGHYTRGSLLETIKNAVLESGKTADNIEIDDLGPLDEFHTGGREATVHLLDQLDIDESQHVLDIGCGLGGASRFVVQQYGSRVTGIDLTPEYIETGNTLCQWVGMERKIHLRVGDATNLDLADNTFDRAYMMHVGMNISDKSSVFREIYRVLRPGGRVGIYDIMTVGEGEVQFPVPWATSASGSALAESSTYKEALVNAGFDIFSEQNRRDFALGFFARLAESLDASGGPPPLGLHILFGKDGATKAQNVMDSISRNVISPVEIIAEKPA